jgi:hypothetical protein
MTTRVLVLTDDRLGPAMAGPAIRALELARTLSHDVTVTLVSTQAAGELTATGVPVIAACDEATLRGLVADHEVLLAGGLFYAQRPWLLASDKLLVLDLYAPFLLEDLARLSAQGELGDLQHAQHRRLLDRQLLRADFMICASERQRDYWLGRLCALGRLTPAHHRQDPTLERLLAVVPFGLPVTAPEAGHARLRGVLPGIDETSCVFVWGGGLWDWLDPLTPIRALALLNERCPEAKLVFLAGASPNPTTPPMPMNTRARALAHDLGLLGHSVHFVDTWVPYHERGSVALEADAGIMAHPQQLESRFAYRTRALDCLWSERPILCTQGDVMAEWVEREGLGLTLASGDTDGWARAFERVARDPAFVAACRARLKNMRPRHTWPEVARPLANYLRSPWPAPRPPGPPGWALEGHAGTLAKVWGVWRAEGVDGLARRIERVRARRRSGDRPQ